MRISKLPIQKSLSSSQFTNKLPQAKGQVKSASAASNPIASFVGGVLDLPYAGWNWVAESVGGLPKVHTPGGAMVRAVGGENLSGDQVNF
jgi:hypothetical protein